MSEVQTWANTAAGNAVAFDDIDGRDGRPRPQGKINNRAIMAAVRRFSDTAINRGGISVLNYGADGTQAGDSAALKAAIAAAASGWLPVLLPARRFFWDSTPITTDKVRIWGMGMPQVNAGKTALEGGTIIEGALICTGKSIDLRDFGVDLGTAGAGPDSDGIKCTSATLNGGISLHTENLVTLAKNKSSLVHSMLFESYQSHTGGNLYAVNGYFGIVIKNRNVQLTDLETEQQFESGVYFKSDNLYGRCSDVQVGSIRTRGADQFGVRVQSDGDDNTNVQIDRVHGADHQRTICIQALTNGKVARNIHFGTVVSERSGIACFSVLTLTAGASTDGVSFGSLDSFNPTAKVIEISNEVGTRLGSISGKRVFASYAAGTSQATMDSAGFIGDLTESSTFDDVQILENYGVGSKIGAFNYANTAFARNNHLGARRAKAIGAAVPQPGRLSQTLSGATATMLIPDNVSGQGKSVAPVTIAAATTITTFSPELATNVYALGHVLYVYNNSGFNLTVAHNVGQGILNQGGVSVVLAANEVCQWMHVGANIWSQVKIS